MAENEFDNVYERQLEMDQTSRTKKGSKKASDQILALSDSTQLFQDKASK